MDNVAFSFLHSIFQIFSIYCGNIKLRAKQER